MESIRLCARLDTLPAKKCLHPFETQNLMFATSIYWTGSMLTFLGPFKLSHLQLTLLA